MAITEDITLRLKIDKTDISGNLNTITKDINDLKDAQLKLNQSFKDGKIGADAYAAESTKLRNEMSALTAQANLAAKAINAEKGSIDEITSALNLNRKAYNSLSQEQRENANIGGKLKETINKQQSALTDLNKTVGRPGLRGGITEAIGGMAKTLGVAALAFVSVEGAVKAFKFVMNSNGDAADAFEQTMAGINEGLKSMARNLLDLDFTNMITGFTDAYNAGKKIKELEQDLGDTKFFQSQKILDINQEIAAKQAEMAKMSAKDLENSTEYKKLLGEVNAKLEERAAIEEEITRAAYEVTGLKVVEELKTKKVIPEGGDQDLNIKDKEDKLLSYIDIIKNFNVEQTTYLNAWLKQVDDFSKIPADVASEANQRLMGQAGLSNATIQGIVKNFNESKEKLLRSEADLFATLSAENQKALEGYIPGKLKESIQKAFGAELSTITEGKQLYDALSEDLKKELIKSTNELRQAEINSISVTNENETKITGIKFREKKQQEADHKEYLANKTKLDKQAVEDEKKFQKELADAAEKGKKEGADWAEKEIARITKLQEEKKKLNDEYNAYLEDSRLATRELQIEAEEDDWQREQDRVQLEYDVKIARAESERDLLIAKLIDDKDFYEKKKEIEKAYNEEAKALDKKRAKDSKQIALDRAAFEVAVVAGWAGDIASILGSLGEESRAMQYGALLIDSAKAIADVFINFKIAQAKGFSQMGPILGIPAATAMEITSGLSIAAIIAKTAKGLSDINSAGKGKSAKSEVPRNNKQYGGEFALGGPINGASHDGGGVLIEAEGGEFIINKRAMKNPYIAKVAEFINEFGVGGPIFPNGVPVINDPKIPIWSPINFPGKEPIIKDMPAIDYARYGGSKQFHPDTYNESLNISSSRGYGNFLSRVSSGATYSGGTFGAGSFSGNAGINGSSGNVSGLAEEIAAAVKSIPVYIVESEMTGMQRKVQVREAKFTI